MAEYVGVKYILDLEACLDFAGAGANRKAALFAATKTHRIAITASVHDQLKMFDKELAEEFIAEGIELVEYDEKIYKATETLGQLLSTSSARLDRAATDKIPILATVHCAQNGSLPKCMLVTGDIGQHKSSMHVLCSELKISVINVIDAF